MNQNNQHRQSAKDEGEILDKFVNSLYDEFVYPVNNALVLILNYQTFPTDIREGSNKDAEDLKQMFEAFNYGHVTVIDDMTTTETYDLLRKGLLTI